MSNTEEQKNSESQLVELKLKNFEFISTILGAEKKQSSFITQFEELKDKEFLDFCNKIIKGTFITNNQIIDMNCLNEVFKEMKLIENFPDLHSKTIGAIAGGFSAGKSAFINSFMEKTDIRLAEGIQPVTAIPSYVVSSKESKIQGVTTTGAVFDMEAETYKSISHEMMESLDFDLKKILKYITVKNPMKSDLFSNICLIDTPGYNPPSVGSTGADYETAKEYVKDADFMIWLVGLDSNGTIPKTDLEFIKSLPFGKEEGKLLYVVGNRASSKTTNSAKEAVLDAFIDALEYSYISYEGISIYDSKVKKEYMYDKKSIYDFLNEQNKTTKIYVPLARKLNSVFKRYEIEINYDDKQRKEKRLKIQNMLLEGLKKGNISADSTIENKLEDGLNELMRFFKSKDKDESLNLLKNTKEHFFNCFDEFCKSMNIEIEDYSELEIVETDNAESEITKTDDTETEIVKTGDIEPDTHNTSTNSVSEKYTNRYDEIKYCTNCGKPSIFGDEYCTQCGYPITKPLVNRNIKKMKNNTKSASPKESAANIKSTCCNWKCKRPFFKFI